MMAPSKVQYIEDPIGMANKWTLFFPEIRRKDWRQVADFTI